MATYNFKEVKDELLTNGGHMLFYFGNTDVLLNIYTKPVRSFVYLKVKDALRLMPNHSSVFFVDNSNNGLEYYFKKNLLIN